MARVSARSSRPARIAALSLAGLVGVAAIEGGATLAARSALARLATAHPGLSIAAVSFEPFSGRLTLRGLTARSGGASISVGTLRLATPSLLAALVGPAMASPFEDQPAPPSATPAARAPVEPPATAPVGGKVEGSSSADNVVIVVGPTTYRIRHIDMTGTALSGADIVALLDSKSTETIEARLKRFTAAAVVVPEILVDETSAGIERHASMTHVLLADVAAGKAAAGSAGEASFAVKDDSAVSNGSTGAIETIGLDLAQIAHVFGTTRTDDAEAIKPLYDSVVVNAVKVTNVTRDSTLTVASIRETGAKARALKTDPFAATEANPSPSDAKSVALFDDMTHSFEIGLLKLTDVSLHSVDPSGTTTATIADASMSDFAHRTIGGLSFAGFHLEAPSAKVDVGTVEIGAFTLPVTQAPDASTMAPRSKVDIRGVAVDVVSKTEKTADKPASSTTVKFTLDKVALAATGKPGDIPTESSLAVDSIGFDVPPDDSAGFNAMGYKHVTLSAALATRYDAGSQELTVDALSVREPTMGSITATMKLLNVGKGLLSSDKNVQLASTIAILAKSLDVKVVNAGLFEKALAYKANKDGMSIAQERDLGITFFKTQMPTIAANNPKLQLIGAAVAKFIADPRTLRVDIVSKSGLGIGAMGLVGTPDLILDTLDVKADADE